MTSISGHSHSFDTGIAKLVGVQAAVVFNHIVYWLKINASKKDAQMIEGKYWMYETQQQMADFFQYMSLDDVKRAMTKLFEAGLLIKDNFNKNPFDKTNWYTVSDQSIIKKTLTKERNRTIEEAKTLHPQCENAPCIYDQEEYIHKEKQQQAASPPAAAAVVVSSKKEEKKKQPTIYSCLQGASPEKLPIDQQVEITLRYPEEVVRNALEYTIANEDKIKTTFVAYLKMACSKQLKVIAPAKEEPKEADVDQQAHNKTLVKEFLKKNWKEEKYGSGVADRGDYVRIGEEKLYFKDLKFQELFKHYIKKLG